MDTPETLGLADSIIAKACERRSTPAPERVADVRLRLTTMGPVQLRSLHELVLQGKSTVIFPQIVRDLGLNFEVYERVAA